MFFFSHYKEVLVLGKATHPRWWVLAFWFPFLRPSCWKSQVTAPRSGHIHPWHETSARSNSVGLSYTTGCEPVLEKPTRLHFHPSPPPEAAAWVENRQGKLEADKPSPFQWEGGWILSYLLSRCSEGQGGSTREKRWRQMFFCKDDGIPHHKKSERMPSAAAWVDLEMIILSEVRQRKTNTTWYHLYVESKKMIQMNFFTKQKQTHRLREQIYGYWGERRRDKLGVWD